MVFATINSGKARHNKFTFIYLVFQYDVGRIKVVVEFLDGSPLQSVSVASLREQSLFHLVMVS